MGLHPPVEAEFIFAGRLECRVVSAKLRHPTIVSGTLKPASPSHRPTAWPVDRDRFHNSAYAWRRVPRVPLEHEITSVEAALERSAMAEGFRAMSNTGAAIKEAEALDNSFTEALPEDRDGWWNG